VDECKEPLETSASSGLKSQFSKYQRSGRTENPEEKEEEFEVIGRADDDQRKKVMTNVFYKLREMMIDGPHIKKLMNATSELNLQKHFFLSSKKLSGVINDISKLRKQRGDTSWLDRFLKEALELLKNNKNTSKTLSEQQVKAARARRE
jgi:hypothetical protein